jgi:4-alpha-glucanotransferase
MSFPRASGILLHPTSLPGKFGIGDFGEEASRFVDFLADAGQTYWQILPLGPTGYGDSPYNCFSAFAGNTLLISPQKLVHDGLLTDQDIAARPELSGDRVDFGAVLKWKTPLLAKAYESFRNASGGERRGEFDSFCEEKASWLNDYALFRAVRSQQEYKPWFKWPDSLKHREENALNEVANNLKQQIEAEKFFQFLFFKQWFELKTYANSKDIKIIGDIPIFVALDSADVWCNQDQFKLNEDGSPKVVSGVPPDFFSATGQLWGNPIYDWDAMLDTGFGWWIARIRSTLEIADIIRIDHFRGFAATWEVPGEDETAVNGKWVEVPGKELFEAATNELGGLPVIVEDLGFMTPEVEKLRDSFGFPGMHILQSAFGGDAKNLDLPHNYIKNCVAYPGTHDNDTIVGWFEGQNTNEQKEQKLSTAGEHCLKYLATDGSEINWDFLRSAWSSVADTAIAQLQDILGLGNDARMNLPATTSGNWNWRLPKNSLTDEIVSRLKDLTEIYGRVR